MLPYCFIGNYTSFSLREKNASEVTIDDCFLDSFMLALPTELFLHSPSSLLLKIKIQFVQNIIELFNKYLYSEKAFKFYVSTISRC